MREELEGRLYSAEFEELHCVLLFIMCEEVEMNLFLIILGLKLQV